MRSKRGLLDVINELGHVHEIARLLWVFQQQRRLSIRESILIEVISHTAALTYRYPNEPALVELCERLGICARKRGYVLLTGLGQRLAQMQGANPVELSDAQSRTVLSLIVEDGEGWTGIREVLGSFLTGPGGRLQLDEASRMVGDSSGRWFRLLQQLGAIRADDGSFVLLSEYEEALGFLPLLTASISEQELWKRLDSQRVRAKLAEEYVGQCEKERLESLGRPDLAQLVARVSADNSGAGYDIQSFDGDDSPRCIEVEIIDRVRRQIHMVPA